MTQQSERSLLRAQRKMLRMILGVSRRRQLVVQQGSEQEFDVDSDVELNVDEHLEQDSDEDGQVLEPWVDWIRRVTHQVEQQTQKLNIQNWVVRARSNKWDLAGKVCHHSTTRWTKRLLDWDPLLVFDGLICRAHRRQAHPKLRWTHDIVQFMQACQTGDTWQQFAENEYTWKANRERFCEGTWRHT